MKVKKFLVVVLATAWALSALMVLTTHWLIVVSPESPGWLQWMEPTAHPRLFGALWWLGVLGVGIPFGVMFGKLFVSDINLELERRARERSEKETFQKEVLECLRNGSK